MNKKLLSIIAFAAIFTACKKDETATPGASTPPVVTTKDGFVWKEDSGSEIVADSAYWTSWATGTGVRAYKNGNANFFEINWDVANNTSVGTKALDPGMGITFLKGAATYTNAGAERMNITAFDSDKLSGNFTVTMTGGAIKEISGTFTNIPKR